METLACVLFELAGLVLEVVFELVISSLCGKGPHGR